jgi:hypothetical protein
MQGFHQIREANPLTLQARGSPSAPVREGAVSREQKRNRKRKGKGREQVNVKEKTNQKRKKKKEAA